MADRSQDPERQAAVLDQGSPVPLYHQLRQALEASWRTQFSEEDDLPTEQDVIDRYRVSRITVRRALDEMIANGVIHRPQPRRRLRLASVKVRQQLNRLRGFFADDALAAGHRPSTRVLDVSPGVWPDVNRLLRLGVDATCYRVSRLHESDGRPLAHQVSFIARDACPDLMLSDLSASLLQMMETRFGRRVQHAEQRLTAREATAAEASLLHLQLRSHVFQVERVSYDDRGQAIEYFISVLDVTRFEFHTSMDAEHTGRAAPLQSPWSAASPPRD